MDIITKIFDFDFAVLVPDLTPLLENLSQIMRWAVLICPILLLAIGLVYLLIPPKEANHRMGYRTFFGMGSVEAWRLTQKIAGFAFGGLGLVLLIVMLVASGGFGELEQTQLLRTTAKCLVWEGSLALLLRVAVSLTVTVLFNRKGQRRW